MEEERAAAMELDDGVLAHLLSFLDAPSLCAASQTCRTWRDLGSEDFLWRALHQKNANPMVSRSEVMRTRPRTLGDDERRRVNRGCHYPSGSGSAGSSSSSMPQGSAVSFKETFALSENWRRGRAQRVLVEFPGSNWNSATRLSRDGAHAVLASAGLGSVEVVDVATGEPCPEFAGISCQQMDAGMEQRDALDAVFASVAISPSCRLVAFGGFDGIVNLYDVSRGSLIASAAVPAQQPAVTALGFCSIQATQVIGAGLADGRVALSPLQAWEVCLGSTSCGLHGEGCNLLGCHSESAGSFREGAPRQITGPWMTCNLGAGVEVRRIKGECGAGAGLSIVAGTSGGHVKVVDGAVGRVRHSLVGSCSCPVKCLSLHHSGEGPPIPEPPVASHQAHAPHMAWGPNSGTHPGPQAQPTPQALSRVVYAGFDHASLGNGHYNAIYVWDVASAARVTLLHPGVSSQSSRRGGRGVCRGRHSVNDLSGMIRSVWADGWKVAISAGKSVTVFETRTWKPLYELSLPSEAHRSSLDGSALAEPSVRSVGPTSLRPQQAEDRFAELGYKKAEKDDLFFSSHSCFCDSVEKRKSVDYEASMLKKERGLHGSSKVTVGEPSCWRVQQCSAGAPGAPGVLDGLHGTSQDPLALGAGKLVQSDSVMKSPVASKSTSPSAEKMQPLELVSESPGSLIFYGDTMALGLKNNRFALVTFGDSAVQGDLHAVKDSQGVQVKRVS